jgi:SAM-dependent methyltransferase
MFVIVCSSSRPCANRYPARLSNKTVRGSTLPISSKPNVHQPAASRDFGATGARIRGCESACDGARGEACNAFEQAPEEGRIFVAGSPANTGLAARVAFDVARAVDYPGTNYGLICLFDCLHDMGDPIAAARHAAKVLAPDGTVMLVEPLANDRVEDSISPVARLYYAASTTLCCAHAISEGGNLVLGAQAGEARLADVFRKAGFARFRRAAETPFNLILRSAPLTTSGRSGPWYRLRPPRTPRSLTREAPRRDAGHESRSVAEFRRREVSVRSHVDAGETLEQRHRTAFGDTSLAVDHQVLL